MKIGSVRIKNFRALKDVEVTFDAVTSLIGPNGAGKSTVLRALDWFFNGRLGDLSDEDCSFGAAEEDIEVQVTFTQLTDRDREELGKYAPEGAHSFTAWKRRSPDGSESLSANAKSYAPFNAIREKASAGEKKAAYNALRESDKFLGLPAWTSANAALSALAAWEAEHTDLLEEAPDALQTNFFGFNSGGKMSGLFDFVLVTADLRASEESLDGKNSIIGRILERTIDRTAADNEIAEIVEDSRRRQQKVYEDKFESHLEELTRSLNGVVESYSPGRSVTVVPSDVELKAPRTTFDVTVVDGEAETAVERQGHGFQRTLLISALQHFATSSAASSEGVICLAIEEPELFQHPVQAQAFAKVLRSLAETPEKRIQVTYATHSPYFVEARHFDQIRRLTRSSGPSPEVHVHAATVDDIKRALTGIIDEDRIVRQIDKIVANDLSNALFSRCALVVEGGTDEAVLYGVGDRDVVGSIEACGLVISAVNGKGSIPLHHAILKTLGVPVYGVFDADSGFEARALNSNKSAGDIKSMRKGHASENRKILKYFGLQEVDFPKGEVLDEVAILEDRIEEVLAEKWPEWSESCLAVEREFGVTLSKNEQLYRVATLEAEGSCPEEFVEILRRAKLG